METARQLGTGVAVVTGDRDLWGCRYSPALTQQVSPTRWTVARTEDCPIEEKIIRPESYHPIRIEGGRTLWRWIQAAAAEFQITGLPESPICMPLHTVAWLFYEQLLSAPPTCPLALAFMQKMSREDKETQATAWAVSHLWQMVKEKHGPITAEPTRLRP